MDQTERTMRQKRVNLVEGRLGAPEVEACPAKRRRKSRAGQYGVGRLGITSMDDPPGADVEPASPQPPSKRAERAGRAKSLPAALAKRWQIDHGDLPDLPQPEPAQESDAAASPQAVNFEPELLNEPQDRYDDDAATAAAGMMQRIWLRWRQVDSRAVALTAVTVVLIVSGLAISGWLSIRDSSAPSAQPSVTSPPSAPVSATRADPPAGTVTVTRNPARTAGAPVSPAAAADWAIDAADNADAAEDVVPAPRRKRTQSVVVTNQRRDGAGEQNTAQTLLRLAMADAISNARQGPAEGSRREGPTKPEVQPAAAFEPPKPVAWLDCPPGLEVSAIMRGSDGFVAIINNKSLSEGKSINGAKIIRISDYSVELEIDGQRCLVGVTAPGARTAPADPPPPPPQQPASAPASQPAK